MAVDHRPVARELGPALDAMTELAPANGACERFAAARRDRGRR